jgi:hypothetical protein
MLFNTTFLLFAAYVPTDANAAGRIILSMSQLPGQLIVSWPLSLVGLSTYEDSGEQRGHGGEAGQCGEKAAEGQLKSWRFPQGRPGGRVEVQHRQGRHQQVRTEVSSRQVHNKPSGDSISN